MELKDKARTIIAIATMFIVNNNYSQTHVVDLATQGIPKNYLNSGDYYWKDVTNKLINFLGTWEYTNGNEKFTITLIKTTKYHVKFSDIGLDYYKDGIDIQYQKLINGQIVYTSPILPHSSFKTNDGLKLYGTMNDYGRLTQTKHNVISGETASEGGQPYRLGCEIEKIMVDLSQNEPQKISFKLYSKDSTGFNSAYQGMPTFSIPDNIIMVKVN